MPGHSLPVREVNSFEERDRLLGEGDHLVGPVEVAQMPGDGVEHARLLDLVPLIPITWKNPNGGCAGAGYISKFFGELAERGMGTLVNKYCPTGTCSKIPGIKEGLEFFGGVAAENYLEGRRLRQCGLHSEVLGLAPLEGPGGPGGSPGPVYGEPPGREGKAALGSA